MPSLAPIKSIPERRSGYREARQADAVRQWLARSNLRTHREPSCGNPFSFTSGEPQAGSHGPARREPVAPMKRDTAAGPLSGRRSTSLAIVFLVSQALFGCTPGADVPQTSAGFPRPSNPSATGVSAARSSTLDTAPTSTATANLKVYRFVPAEDPLAYDTELDSKTLELFQDIDLTKTVLVSIDFWEGVAPDAVMSNANQVIDLARRHNVKIVHAPTGTLSDINPMVNAVDDYPNEWVMEGLDYQAFDQFLNDYGIENILYIGFDNGFCVFFKPLGIDMQHQRTPNMNLILIKDATDSSGSLYWVSQWANNTVEYKFASTTITDLATALSDSVNLQPFADVNMEDEGYSLDGEFGADIIPSQTALVLINPWAGDDNDGWSARIRANNQQHLAPLLDLARKNGMKVVYVPNQRPIDPSLAPRDNEPSFADKPSLWSYLWNQAPPPAGTAGKGPPLLFDGSSYVELGNAPQFRPNELTVEVTVTDRDTAISSKILCLSKSIGLVDSPYAAYQIRKGDDGTSLYYQYYRTVSGTRCRLRTSSLPRALSTLQSLTANRTRSESTRMKRWS